MRLPFTIFRRGLKVLPSAENFSCALMVVAVLLANRQSFAGDAPNKKASVVVYTSQDQVFADPIFKDFEKQTGIKVKAVFDSEAVKTVGLVNRLLAEKKHPQCDVFWNNEEFRTRQLETENLFRETNGWAAMGYRTRRLVVNTNLVSLEKAPRSFSEVTNDVWRGKVAMAYPLFGTTGSHFLALNQAWGQARWQNWCHALVKNKSLLVDGNSVVVKLVGSGEAALGFTDSDDIAAGQREGMPIAAAPVCEETLFIPNTIGVVRGGPNPVEAQKLFEYLQSPEVRKRLVAENALESTDLPKKGTGLNPDWKQMLQKRQAVTTELQKTFLR